jgi:hypothetical protein
MIQPARETTPVMRAAAALPGVETRFAAGGRKHDSSVPVGTATPESPDR